MFRNKCYNSRDKGLLIFFSSIDQISAALTFRKEHLAYASSWLIMDDKGDDKK